SNTGVLLYQSGTTLGQPTWFDRTGKSIGKVGPPGQYIDFSISPAGTRVAAQREDGTGGADIWLIDFARDASRRFTLGPDYHAGPIWSPDESRMGLFVIQNGRWSL